MILSREKRYLSAVFLFFASGAIQADVPYVFQDGDTIRADEINENFASLSEKISGSSGTDSLTSGTKQFYLEAANGAIVGLASPCTQTGCVYLTTGIQGPFGLAIAEYILDFNGLDEFSNIPLYIESGACSEGGYLPFAVIGETNTATLSGNLIDYMLIVDGSYSFEVTESYGLNTELVFSIGHKNLGGSGIWRVPQLYSDSHEPGDIFVFQEPEQSGQINAINLKQHKSCASSSVPDNIIEFGDGTWIRRATKVGNFLDMFPPPYKFVAR